MRLVISSQEKEKMTFLADYLKNQGIDDQLEVTQEGDWGNDNYGTATYRLWIVDEDDFDKAQSIVKSYFDNPDNPFFHEKKSSAAKEEQASPTSELSGFNPPKAANESASTTQRRDAPGKSRRNSYRGVSWGKEPMGLITLYFLVGCFLIFFATEITAPVIKEPISTSLPQIPLYYSNLKKDLLFDYPAAFEIVDKLVQAFGIEKLQTPEELPKEALSLLNQFFNTPYWTGYYDQAVAYLSHPESYQPSQAPLFEKIKKGELWRLFTPSLLHADIFHIIFNMMWLAVLGKQLEQRMGRWRYIFFIVATGIAINVIQYFAGGSNFLGFSGILCAMLTFVWMRQRRFPWEGYQLQPSTFGFMMFFLFTMLAIQLVSFYTEVHFNQSIAPPIANSSHMSGLAIGLILGRLNFFSWR